MRAPLIAIALTILPMTALTLSTAQAAERALSFPVGGVVAAVKVKSGQHVQAGDVLAVLDLRTFEAAKRAADVARKATKTIFELADVRYNQTKELFDALSTSAENVETAQIERARALMAFEDANRDAVLAQWNLERATLKAPFSGTVSAVPGYSGQVVSTMSSPIDVVVINSESD